MHKCKVLLEFVCRKTTTTQPTDMEIARPTYYDEVTEALTIDLINVLHNAIRTGLADCSHILDEAKVAECGEDGCPMITVNGRRFKLRLSEIR